MRIIAIGSGKGGVGRSTIAANLGVFLAKKGNSTLVVDGSLTSPSQALFFNLEKVPRTLNDVLNGGISLEEAVYKGPKEVRVLPAAVKLKKMRDVDPSRLPEIIEEQAGGYDYVLIDTPNGLREETVAALKAGRELLIVTVPEIASVSDSMKTKAASEFLGLNPVGLILNQVVDEDYELGEEDIEGILNLPVLESIPFDKKVHRSINKGEILLDWDSDSPAAGKIKKLGEKLMEEN